MRNIGFYFSCVARKGMVEFRLFPNVRFSFHKEGYYINGAHYNLGIEWLCFIAWIGWTPR